MTPRSESDRINISDLATSASCQVLHAVLIPTVILQVLGRGTLATLISTAYLCADQTMAVQDFKRLNLLGLSPTGDLGPFTMYTSQRGRPVWFPKSPPLSPPSLRQIEQRNKWRNAAAFWRSVPAAEKRNWKRAADRVRLRITHLNLFIYWATTARVDIIQTVERNSGIQLLPIGWSV